MMTTKCHIARGVVLTRDGVCHVCGGPPEEHDYPETPKLNPYEDGMSALVMMGFGLADRSGYVHPDFS